MSQHCAENQLLRKRVEQLLSAHAQPNRLLDLGSPVVTTHQSSELRELGMKIGPYKLLEQIGEGGMGVVYMAGQEQPVRRLVALKIIKPGMDSKHVITRFEAERQALAMMDHPHIARVLDAGTTESGRPFFAMELVKGIPITDFCNQQRLGRRERLRIFVDVCHAVQHAHQKGIIHRDLKPSNVLVTILDGRPLVKVIDFGIAKAVAQQLTDKTLFTGFGQPIGTPLYMSPEQFALSGSDVDTRSDVYSLGVLLYQLLTGTTPFDTASLANVSFDELRRIICEEQPPRPSARISTLKASDLSTLSNHQQIDAQKLVRHLHGELDWIVMKALDKDRSRRYESASAFAADVQGHLDGKPVIACPPSWSYQIRKFAARHRVALATSAVIVTLLVTTAAVSLWFAVDAYRARKLADKRHAEAEADFKAADNAVTGIVARMALEPRLSSQDFHEYRKDILSRLARHYKDLSSRHPDRPGLQEMFANALGLLADVKLEMGHFESARADIEQKIQIYSRRVQADPKPNRRAALAESRHILGLILRALAQPAQAEQELRASINLWTALAKDSSERRAEYQKNLAISHGNLGIVLLDQGQFDDAQNELREAIRIGSSLNPDLAKDPGYAKVFGAVHTNLGMMLSDSGKPEEACIELGIGLSFWKAFAAGTLQGDPEARAGVAGCRLGLARAWTKTGDTAKARAEYEAAVQLLDQLVQSFPRVVEYRELYTKSAFQLGTLLFEMGDLTAAEDRYRAALSSATALNADFPATRGYLEAIADSREQLGDVLRDQGKSAASETEYRESLAARDRLMTIAPDAPEYPVRSGILCLNLGNRARKSGSHEEALTWYGQSIEVLITRLGAEPGDETAQLVLGQAYWGRAEILALAQRHDEAVRDWDRASQYKTGQERSFFRLKRACSLAYLEPSEALREAEQILNDEHSPLQPENYYDGACIYALLYDKESNEQQRETLGKRAVDLLEKARTLNYFDTMDEVEHLKTDTDLNSIRARQDFQDFLERLSAPATG